MCTHTHKHTISIVYTTVTSRVPTVLLRWNLTNSYISYQIFFPKAYHRPGNSIRIVEYHRKNIPKPNILTGSRTQDSFWVCNICSCIIFSETNNFVLGSILLSCLVTELQKPPSPGLEPRTDFVGYGVLLQSTLWNKEHWSWCRSSNVLSFQISETTLTGTRTQDTFRILTFLESLSSFKA
jgi:hypothetical protein